MNSFFWRENPFPKWNEDAKLIPTKRGKEKRNEEQKAWWQFWLHQSLGTFTKHLILPKYPILEDWGCQKKSPNPNVQRGSGKNKKQKQINKKHLTLVCKEWWWWKSEIDPGHFRWAQRQGEPLATLLAKGRPPSAPSFHDRVLGHPGKQTNSQGYVVFPIAPSPRLSIPFCKAQDLS